MNLALDATYSLSNDLSGVGVYSRELLFGLANAYQTHEWDFCYRPHRFRKSLRERFPPNARRRILFEKWGNRSGLFHGLNQRLPLRRFQKQVATFHDLFVLTGEYSSREFRARFAQQARHAAAEADRVIAVSQFTADQVVELLGVDRSRVRVVHHGIRALPGSHAQPENLILSVGAIQTRKNTGRLVAAFEAVPLDWRLCLAGSLGFGADKILQQIENSPARDRIDVTGYVSAPELAALYSRARVFAFPSLDEGFGMPILEAMAAGVPVVASNRSAIPEVCGSAAVLVDPLKTEELACALLELIRTPLKRAELSMAGLARVREFSWEKAVEQTWSVYQEMASD